MADPWRLIDTGLRGAAENIALNRALLEARQTDEAPNTLRFLRFTPSALIGFHQSPAQELDLDFCRAHGITVQRRITGGGAIYFDETQIGWELYLRPRDLGTRDMQAITRRICEAAARGISALGVDARFRPRNDIEVNGRKLSGTGGAFDGDALIFQGTLLVNFDVEKMLRVLRVPAEKLSDKAIASARERVVNLAELMGEVPAMARVQQVLADAFAEAFGVCFEPGQLLPVEEHRFAAALPEIESDGWVNLVEQPAADAPMLMATQKFPSGLIRAYVAYDRPRRRIKQVCFSGDFFVSPKRLIVDLEAALRDIDARALRDHVAAFFAAHEADLMGLAAESFAQVVEQALANLERLPA